MFSSNKNRYQYQTKQMAHNIGTPNFTEKPWHGMERHSETKARFHAELVKLQVQELLKSKP